MDSRMSLDQIRAFWTSQAAEHGQASDASWSDRYAMELEIREITGCLRDGDSVLDVGCANGFSTVQFAAQRKVRVRGVDYIPAMVEQAKLRARSVAASLLGTVEFATGDAMNLTEPAGAYDAVLCIRMLINLGNWTNQALALDGLARTTRPGGRLLISEATVQGWQRLNALRQEWGLDPIGMPHFNQYLDEERVVEHLAPVARLVEIRNFASSYFVATRVVKPLLAKSASRPIDVAAPLMEWNRLASMLPAAGDYGTQKLFVFERR
jgi:ubiquinone/menaquinone biosynthesis C-methylase UbiE